MSTTTQTTETLDTTEYAAPRKITNPGLLDQHGSIRNVRVARFDRETRLNSFLTILQKLNIAVQSVDILSENKNPEYFVMYDGQEGNPNSYLELRIGDVLLPYDVLHDGAMWVTVPGHLVGQKISLDDHCPYRRPINTDTEGDFLYVEPGDLIQKSDEFYDGAWDVVDPDFVGKPVLDYQLGLYRRLI